MEVKPMSGIPAVRPGCYFESLAEEELLDCRGGSLKSTAWWAVATLIISNWQDIREGFNDGVSGKPARY